MSEGQSQTQTEATTEAGTETATETVEETATTETAETSTEETAGTETQEETKAPEGAPEEYTDFTMPEGFPVDEALLNDFKPLAKELNLPQEQAQKLIDLYGEKVAPLMIQRQQDAWNQQLETWVNECKADKEIGGDKFESAVSDAQRVINTIGTPELKQVFDQYGLGNNPELVRAFSRMAKYLKEDSLETGGSTAQQSDVAKKFYPNMA